MIPAGVKLPSAGTQRKCAANSHVNSSASQKPGNDVLSNASTLVA